MQFVLLHWGISCLHPATALDVRFIFAERADGEMTIRRGFEVNLVKISCL